MLGRPPVGLDAVRLHPDAAQYFGLRPNTNFSFWRCSSERTRRCSTIVPGSVQRTPCFSMHARHRERTCNDVRNRNHGVGARSVTTNDAVVRRVEARPAWNPRARALVERLGVDDQGMSAGRDAVAGDCTQRHDHTKSRAVTGVSSDHTGPGRRWNVWARPSRSSPSGTPAGTGSSVCGSYRSALRKNAGDAAVRAGPT